MKLSLFLAIACSCGLMVRAATAAEFLDAAVAIPSTLDYEAQVPPSPPSPSDLQDAVRSPSDMAMPGPAGGCGMKAVDCDECCDPCWTIRAGAVIMKRSDPNAFPIFINSVGGATLVDAGDYRFDYRGGIDVGAIRSLNSDWDFDFRYFAIDSWTASRTNALAGGAILNNPAPVIFFGFSPADSVYGSNLYSTEFNLRRRREWVNTYIGYRYVELNEDLNFILNAGIDAAYSESTDNRLHGLQIGADANIWNNGGRLSLDGWLKAGIYYDYIRHRGQIEFPPGTTVFTPVNQRDNNTAFLGEIGLVGIYQLTDAIAIRGGYQLLWLDGVTLASEQVQVTNFATGTGTDVHGDVFFHGALIGLEAQW
jgi:hypothetical protein